MVKHGKMRAFSPAQERQLATEYEAGSSIWVLANRHGVAYQTIDNALKRCNVIKRPVGKEIRWTGSAEQEQEVLALYAQGMRVKDVARHMGTRDARITNTLMKHSVGRRPGGTTYRRFSDAEAKSLGEEYAHGNYTLRAFAVRHATNEVTMRNTLRRVGVHTRHLAPLKWTPSRCQWLLEQFRSGRPVPDLAKELGLEIPTVRSRLRVLGVEALPRPQARRVGQKGYVEVSLLPEDVGLLRPMANGCVLEHRLVMARSLGRELTRREQVHHINGVKTDNRLENLQLRQGHHGPGVVMTCNSCGSHDIKAAPIAS